MTAPKHTPGPWGRNIPPATRYPVVFAGRNTHIAIISMGSRNSQTLSDEEIEANCNLITAAPDLFAACTPHLSAAARKRLEETAEAEHAVGDSAVATAIDLLLKWQDDAARAIAKAEGR